MKQFIIKISIITFIIAFTGWVVFNFFIPQHFLPVFPFLLLFFAGSSVFIYGYNLKLAKKEMGKFTRSTMIVTFLKLMFYSAVAIIYMAVDTENAKTFVAVLLLLYLVYTVIEVVSLVNISTKNNTGSN